jgi:hypothetical protein
MDYSAIQTAVSNPAHLEKMAALAKQYGLPLDQGFAVSSIQFEHPQTGGNRGFALIIRKDGEDLIESDRLTEDPYGFWTRRALKKIVKRAIKVAA